MFKLPSRRYTGAKTRLLAQIESVFLRHLGAFENLQNLSFFDVFAGTGVVAWHFMQKFGGVNLNSQSVNLSENSRKNSLNLAKNSQQNKNSQNPRPNSNFTPKTPHFSRFLINDFLHSNYAIYQGFFGKGQLEMAKLQSLARNYNAQKSVNLSANYYEKAFGGLFFSKNDAAKIGLIRDDLDTLLKGGKITQKEFYALLASLLYSADRVANTVGHYDAYRKNAALQDRLKFELIEPFECECEIFREDANALAKKLQKKGEKIDLAFIDPPYNSRQYARFYHLLETLAKNDKPTLYGIARKPKPDLISAYCKSEAVAVFEQLVECLAGCVKMLVVTYNNTYASKSSSSHNKITLEQIVQILENVGKTNKYEFDFKAFTSGKTDFVGHKEMIFVCEIKL